RPRDQTTDAQMLVAGAVSAVQLAGTGGLDPVLQRLFAARQQLAQRAAEPVLRWVAGDALEASRQIAQAQLLVGFPEPVGGGLGDVAEAHFAGLEGFAATLQLPIAG